MPCCPGLGLNRALRLSQPELTKLLAVYSNGRIMQILSKIGVRVLRRKYLFCQFIVRKILEASEKNKTNQNN